MSDFACAELTVGQLNAIVKKLGGKNAAERFLRGELVVQPASRIIDCDADPFIPQGWTVNQHIKGGQLEWDPSKMELFLSEDQKNRGFIRGDKLRAELVRTKKVLNANVLDYLLSHQELIPEEWKGKAIYFWGTLYRGSGGYLCVRYLCWDGGRWFWGCDWLDNDWSGCYPAVCLQV